MAAAILYGKPGCHLCEDAAAILDSLSPEGLRWRHVDIEGDAGLFERFRHSIPVIEIEGGPTLDWPTTRERVRRAALAAANSE